MTAAVPNRLAADLVVRTQQRTSVVINVLLSAAFFVLVFGIVPHPLSLGKPDGLAADFIPQSLAIAFFSAFVPALIVSAKRRRGEITGVTPNGVTWSVALVRALGFAAAAGVFGTFLAFTLPLIVVATSYAAALAAKLVYGGLLGWVVTPAATRLVLR